MTQHGSTTAQQPNPIASMRIIGMAFMMASIAAPVCGYFVAMDPFGAIDPFWPLAMPLLGVVLAFAAAYVLGPKPLDAGVSGPSAEAEGDAKARTMVVMRAALAEMPAVYGVLAAALQTSGGGLTALIGGAASLMLVLWMVFPHQANIDSIERHLDKNGGRSNFNRWTQPTIG